LVTHNYYEVEGILSGYATGKSLLNVASSLDCHFMHEGPSIYRRCLSVYWQCFRINVTGTKGTNNLQLTYIFVIRPIFEIMQRVNMYNERALRAA